MSSEHPRRSWRRVLIVLGVLVALFASAAVVYAITREDDVSNPNVEFRAEPTQTPVPTDEPAREGKKKKAKKKRNPLAGFRWSHYGYSKDRRRHLTARPSLKPPFKLRWSWDGEVLLEFPPIIVGNRLFLTKNNGVVVALNRTTGKKVWRRDMGYLAASSPAFGNGRIYITILERERGEAGRVAALRPKDGKLIWSRPLASRTESSPLHDGNFIYFGAEDGSVYAMRDSTGKVKWKFRASGAVKGGLALDGGKLYFGAYGGTAYALWKAGGKLAWSNGAPGGNLYSTPAVAFGRVYVGSTNGRMYSFSSATGNLAWSRSTGSYVYASPAVAQVPGGQPTVYFGSYDGTFYALDARSGSTRWTYHDGGKISGAATVVGNVVYYANWGKRNSTALAARTGRRLWTNSRGSFNAVVSDGEIIYLTGFSSVGAFQPRSEWRKERRQARKEKRQKRREKRERREQRESRGEGARD